MGLREKTWFYHIMFLPIFGEMDGGAFLNILTIAVFFAIYLWHTKHDHKHNSELLDEVKKIRTHLENRFRGEMSEIRAKTAKPDEEY